MFIKKNKLDKILLTFLVFHLVVWTLIPTISNLNLPLDTIEALAWGSNLDWGFNKHPPLSALAVEIFYIIFGSQDWAYYFLSQIFVITSFYVVYKFSAEFLDNKILGLVSLLLLEGILFYNYTTPEFNVNVCQLPFWALSIFFTWRCTKYEKPLDYAYLGLFISLGILSKYLFIYLVLGIKLYFIYTIIKKGRFSISNYLISATVAMAILIPHINWLIGNDFSTILYAFQRTGGIGNLQDHVIHPVIFLVKQLILLMPFILMSFFAINKFKTKINLKDEKFIFIIFTVLIPLILIFLTSVLFGVKIRTMWMTPFYLFFGVSVVYIFKNCIDINKLKGFIYSLFFFLILSPIIYFTVSTTNDSKRTDYPGREIARLVQNKWDKNFANEIKVVIGDEWSAGNLSYHLVSRPKWILDLKDNSSIIRTNDGVVYTGNPKVLKEVCPGIFGEIKPVGYCMIGQK